MNESLINMSPMCIETAESIIDFSGKNPELEELAKVQMSGAVALHNMIADPDIGLAYLADEVGMGKTYVALGVVALMRYFNPRLRVLYICPGNNVQDKWIREYNSFIEKNIMLSHFRVRTPQGKSAVPYVNCRRVRDLIEYAASGHYADFFVGKGMFSLAMNTDEKSIKNNLEDLKEILPGYVVRDIQSQSVDKLKEKAKIEYARALNHILPTFDLVIIDESHNFKHGFETSDRNKVLSRVLGFYHDVEGYRDIDFFPRVKNALLLSATPYDRDIEQLANQLRMVGKYSLFEAMNAKDQNTIKDTLRRFMVRRLNRIEINGVSHTRNMYRHEARKTAAIDITDDEQKLVTALVTKKIGDMVGKKGASASFQTGMLASFESYQETNQSGPVEFDGEKNDRKYTDAKDRHIISSIVDSYKQAGLGRTLPHPKMNKVTENLAHRIFKEGRKQLIFVRRVKSIKEIKEKLDEEYNSWLHDYLATQLDGEIAKVVENIYELYLENSKDKDLDISGGDAVLLSQDKKSSGDEQGDETQATRRNDTFFSWFFSGETDPDVQELLDIDNKSWPSPHNIRTALNRRTQSVGILLQFNWFNLLSSTSAQVAEILDDPVVSNEIARNAGCYLALDSKTTHYIDIFSAVQASLIEYLQEHKSFSSLQGIRERFFSGKQDKPKFIITIDQVRENLTAWTLFDELNIAGLLPSICPLLSKVLSDIQTNEIENIEQELRQLEVHRYLIDILLRTAHGMIDLYIARLKLGTDTINSGRRTKWIKNFVSSLQTQKNQPGFSTWHELSQLAEQLELVIKSNMPEIYDQQAGEYRKYLSNLITPVFPVFGASGETLNQRSAQARKFRMPGYPLALVSTDVFQEGEDLHLFCADVVHYGLSGSPVSIEQKIGRVDRVGALAQRRLLQNNRIDIKDFIQVEYPYVKESIELLQVRKLCQNINEFIKSLHEIGSNNSTDKEEIDTAKELSDRSAVPEKINDFLKSPYEETIHPENDSIRVENIINEGKRCESIIDHINGLFNKIINLPDFQHLKIHNAIKSINNDALTHLQPGCMVATLISARASSDMLLSITRRMNTDISPPFNDKSLLLSWLVEHGWQQTHRLYVTKCKVRDFDVYSNAELVIGHSGITSEKDVQKFVERFNTDMIQHQLLIHPVENKTCINILQLIDAIDFADFGITDDIAVEYLNVGKQHQLTIIFRPDEKEFSRKHVIDVMESDGRCLLQSRITEDGFFDRNEMK